MFSSMMLGNLVLLELQLLGMVSGMISLIANLSLIGGLLCGVILFGIGIMVGMQVARSRAQSSGEVLSENDREQMLQLLQQLGTWAHDYSENVSGYQDQLGKLSAAVESGVGPTGASASESRVMLLLQQIMDNNESLQNRLETAERQLDKQTQQIECYLTEARTDGMTGLFNRRAFDKRLDEGLCSVSRWRTVFRVGAH